MRNPKTGQQLKADLDSLTISGNGSRNPLKNILIHNSTNGAKLSLHVCKCVKPMVNVISGILMVQDFA